MACVRVRCWQETYRGLMPDAVLDDPGFSAARERMWTEVLTSGRYRQHRVAVAGRDGELTGIAMSGPPEDVMAARTRQLYVLYVYAAGHGTGAGRALLEAVIDPASRPRCGSPIPILARRRSTASTASPPTGRLGPATGCGRSAWSAACSTTGPAAPAAGNPSVAAPAGKPDFQDRLSVC
jgi:GNAT superfamily N-acetyltransferase